MCKLYLNKVEVQSGPGGIPFSFLWKGTWHLIEYCYTYEIRLRDYHWYRSMGLDPYQTRYRCTTDSSIDCDLVHEKGIWVLERVWD